MATLDPKDRLYRLLPHIYQLRDADQGEPLREFLQIIAEQVEVVEKNIKQLYDNCFIETCADWVVPYLGDLVGYTPVHEAGEPGEMITLQGRVRTKILTPRQEVANTIRYRRKKGSLALLELLANDVAGWPARAVEFYKMLAWTQHINHPKLKLGATVDLRKMVQLADLDSPFDSLAHTVEVRRINSHRSQGRSNLPSVGLFVWRLKTYSVTATPINSLEQRCYYTFSALENDCQLYNKSQPQQDTHQIADKLNLPVPISRSDLSADLAKAADKAVQAKKDLMVSSYYGNGRSFVINAPDWPTRHAPQPIPAKHIVVADLSNWDGYRTPYNKIAVDPELGRILFPARQLPKKGVAVSYYYGFSANIGGGEYARPLSQPEGAESIYVGQENNQERSIAAALAKWKQSAPTHAVIEITDSRVYAEALKIDLKPHQTLQIRAANKKRPIIRLADRPDQFNVSGWRGSYLTLDGLLIMGRNLQIDTAPEHENLTDPNERSISGFIIKHSTFVPGWTLKSNCEPDKVEDPSIEITNVNTCITIEHSIVGSIVVNIDEVGLDPIKIRVSDSILDATGSECDEVGCEVISASGAGYAHAVLSIVRSTVLGQVKIHAVMLAENTIFKDLLNVARRQSGCLRFCYVPFESRTPKRFNCQPDLGKQAAEDQLIGESLQMPDQSAIAQARLDAQETIRPIFSSTRYGKPAYCQLAETCPMEIKRGAEDESEMGVFHDLFQPQREANLLARLEEYIPARTDVGIILAS